MSRLSLLILGLLGLGPLGLVGQLSAADTYHEVAYPPSEKPGELQFGVTYTLWIPDGVPRLRGLIVHQHGCGEGACKGGVTAAYDLHWQALARKWGCGLLGPSFQQKDDQNCRLWCDPRNGSRTAFLNALRDLAAKSGHPEVETVPWCLWGHSGGGFWASLMQASDPERIVAIWLRSGTAFSAWEKGEIPKPELPPAAFGIPVIANPGVKERDDARFKGAWTGAEAMFRAYRAQGAPIGFAGDPRTGHECGDSRYLAIPFFDACLALRLPDPDAANQSLKPIDLASGWLAPFDGDRAVPASQYRGDPAQAIWLPNEQVASIWAHYIATGAAPDTTPPPAPVDVRISYSADGAAELTWSTTADLESGLASFIIERDGQPIATLPEKPVGRFGRPLFQAMSYHDTPEAPMPAMRFVDPRPPGRQAAYRIFAVNSVGLRSEPAVAEPASR